MFISLLAYLVVEPKNAAAGSIQETRRTNALKTLLVFVETMLSKDLGGWEIMEVFAGSVSASDEVFTVGFPSIPPAPSLPISDKSYRSASSPSSRTCSSMKVFQVLCASDNLHPLLF